MSNRYDKEAIFDTQIDPLLRQIIAICKEHEIPHVAAFFLAKDTHLAVMSDEIEYPHTPKELKAAAFLINRGSSHHVSLDGAPVIQPFLPSAIGVLLDAALAAALTPETAHV